MSGQVSWGYHGSSLGGAWSACVTNQQCAYAYLSIYPSGGLSDYTCQHPGHLPGPHSHPACLSPARVSHVITRSGSAFFHSGGCRVRKTKKGLPSPQLPWKSVGQREPWLVAESRRNMASKMAISSASKQRIFLEGSLQPLSWLL